MSPHPSLEFIRPGSIELGRAEPAGDADQRSAPGDHMLFTREKSRGLRLLFGLMAAGTAASAYTVDSTGALLTDGSVGDVNAAIAGAASGATIRLPAGSFTWNGPVAVNKPVTLSGAGPGSTQIQLGPAAPTGTSGAFQVTAAATVGDFSLAGAGSATAFSVGTASGWRITNVTYQANGDASYFCFIGGSYGLIDRCELTSDAGNDELIFGRGPADSWQTPLSLGSADAVYIEDCAFHGPGYVCDANGNARFVVRFCTITGPMKVDAHGYASNTPRGVRQIEVYGNRWTYGAAGSSDPVAYFAEIELRGGTGMVFDNVSDQGARGAGWYFLTDYGYEGAWPNFGSVEQTPVNYPLRDQIGIGADRGAAKGTGGAAPLYSWHNLQRGATWTRTLKPVDPAALALYQTQTASTLAAFGEADVIKPDRDVFLDQTAAGGFDGSTGVGRGTGAGMRALAPTRAGVGYWVTDEGQWNTAAGGPSGQLYVWNGASWVLKYTPFVYPHPARGQAAGGGAPGAGAGGAGAQVAPPTVTASATRLAAGDTAMLGVARQAGAAAYQWACNGRPLPGATGATLALANAGAYQSGNYTVSITTGGGTATSAAIPVAIAARARLVNLSARGFAGASPEQAMSLGLVAAGTAGKQLLVRGIGPALQAFGVPGALPATALTLFDSSGTPVASDTGWGSPPQAIGSAGEGAVAAAPGSGMAAAGAFPLAAGSADSALLATVGPGAFTASLAGVGSAAGIGLAEVYDLDASGSGATLINLSARAGVGPGAHSLVAGFVISGATSQTVLLRAIGPALGAFGVPGPLAQPRLTLFDGGLNGAAPAVVATNTGWASGPAVGSSLVAAGLQSATAALIARVAAFALPAGSADSALVATLPPGAYTVQVDAADGGTGAALVEIYDLH